MGENERSDGRDESVGSGVAAAAATGAVIVAAGAGQLLAGDDPRAELEALPETALSLPLQVWIVVAAAYYLISWVVVYRLVRGGRPARPALWWYAALMAGNEIWNLLLFGFESVGPAAIGMVGFALLAIVVALALRRTDDRWPLIWFAPYLMWVVGYDVPWIASVWSASR